MKTPRLFFSRILLFTLLFVVSIVHAQQFGLNAGAGMSFPIQEFSDTYASGLTGQLSGEYRIMGSISLVVSTGYARWSIRDGVGQELLTTAQLPGTLAISGHIRNIPVSLGVRYYNIGSYGYSFLGLATGSNLMKGFADATYDPKDGTSTTSLSVQESWSSTGFIIEAGTGFTLDDTWSVLVLLSYANILDLKHDILPRSQGIPVTASPAQARAIGVTIGLQYR